MNKEPEYNIDEVFNDIEHTFNGWLKELNISQNEIDEISKKNGYYPAEKIGDASYDKELKLFTIMKHYNKVSKKIYNIKWHLSAMNKLIKDYKTFM